MKHAYAVETHDAASALYQRLPYFQETTEICISAGLQSASAKECKGRSMMICNYQSAEQIA